MAFVIQQDICSGCHTCELLYPTGAIRMNFSKYQIDADKCVLLRRLRPALSQCGNP